MHPAADAAARPTPPRTLAGKARDWLMWVGPARAATAAATAIAITAGAAWLLRPSPAPTESRLPFTPAATAPPGGPPPSSPAPDGGGPVPAAPGGGPAEVVVHVAGAVLRPGVYRLAAPARAVDALEAAGGPASGADTDAVNLAAPVADGGRVYVPRAGEVAPGAVVAGGGGDVVPGPVDLNTATAAQLDELPGVGPSTAAAIVEHRAQHGPFASVEELADVRGIGPAKLEAFRDAVTV